MRDLNRYPITDDEILATLREIQQEIADKYKDGDAPIGDIRGAVIAEIRKRVEGGKL